MENLERRFEIIPGYDFRKETNGNYGCLGCELRFAVIGEAGVASLTIYTDWFPETVATNLPMKLEKPWVVDVGWHSATPIEYLTERPNCHLLAGKSCWYDGTSLNDRWQRGIIHGGTNWLWRKMEELYWFFSDKSGEVKYPDLTVQPRKMGDKS